MSPEFRVGLGTDLHRLVDGNPLVIGGVRIQHDRGPDAHSDGDVLLHAVVDALLGATGSGDIGELFPDTDSRFKNADSALFVRRAMEVLKSSGWRLVNVDATVTTQSPRLKDHKPAIRQRMAEVLGIPVERVNIKAKTGERVGPIGREEAIGSDVVVLIERPHSS